MHSLTALVQQTAPFAGESSRLALLSFSTWRSPGLDQSPAAAGASSLERPGGAQTGLRHAVKWQGVVRWALSARSGAAEHLKLPACARSNARLNC